MNNLEYLKSLKDETIKYRYKLNLPSDVTFGIEIEYENIVKDTLSYYMDEFKTYDSNYKGWYNTDEIDIQEVNNNGEIVNGEIKSPILKDNINDWKNLKNTINILNKNSAVITEKCGGHINVGAQVLGSNKDYWRNFLLLWILYEKEIYKFSSGEFNKVRNQKNNLLNRIAPELYKNLDFIIMECDISTAFPYINYISDKLFDKAHDLSFCKVESYSYKKDNVIEFRLPNGSLHEEIWQNYINFFTKLLLACKKDLDVEKVLYKIKNSEHNAIELADYIFDNDIDKNYFLIQTLKTNKIYKKELTKHIVF